MEFKTGQVFSNHKEVYRFGWLCHKKGACKLKLVSIENESSSWFVRIPDAINYGASVIKHEELLEEFSLTEVE